MRYPHFLPENGTIGFVAPSFGCAVEPYRSAFDHALERLQALGYRVKLGKNCYASGGIGISNTPAACAGEVNDFYRDPSVDVLLSCGGGELMCEILDGVDFDAFREAEPKWFMGYSDNTNITFLLPTLCDTASIYGPCAGVFGMEPWHPSVSDAYELLTGRRLSVGNYDLWEKEGGKSEENPLAPYHVTEPVRLRVFSQGDDRTVRLSGRLLGGCMDCLVNLTGTVYDRVKEYDARYASDGILWFLESCDLNVFAIRRAIWQMKHAGWFSHVSGFLIGRPLVYGQELMGLDQYHAVYDLLAEYGVPVIMDVDLGHLPPMMPLICGSLAEVTCVKEENGSDASSWRLAIDMKLG